MSYCTKCGRKLEADEICSCTAGMDTASEQQAPVQNEWQHQENNFPLPVEHPSEPASNTSPDRIAPLLGELTQMVKRFFSCQVTETVGLASKNTTLVWAVLGGIFSLLYAFVMLSLPGNLLGRAISGALSGAMRTSTRGLLPGGTLFFLGLLLGILIYFSYVLLIKALFAIHKHKVDIKTIFGVVSAALMPYSVSLAAALLVGFIFPSLSLLLMLTGNIASIVLLYIGIQKTVKFTSSPFWTFTAVCFLVSAVAMLFTIQVILPEIAGSLVDAIGSLISYGFGGLFS